MNVSYCIKAQFLDQVKAGKKTSHYIFSPEEAYQMIRIIDLFYSGWSKIQVSWWNNPAKDHTVSLCVVDSGIMATGPTLQFFKSESGIDIQETLKQYKTEKTPEKYRKLITDKFF